jgi:DNA polymerase-3 subunit gamma/tau
MLTQEAFNALLKTLEEPPPGIMFILATTDPQKIPPTIISRCLRFDFRRIPDELIEKRLEEIARGEGIEYEKGALGILARYADGSLRDALAYMEEAILYGGGSLKEKDVVECLGVPSYVQIKKFLLAVYRGDINRGLEVIDETMESGVDPKIFIDNVISELKDMALKSDKTQEINWSLEEIARCISTMEDISLKLRWYSFPRLVLEVGLVKLISNFKKATVISEVQKPEIPVIELSADFSKIKDLWPLFLESVRKESIRLHAVLRECFPVSFTDNTLVIGIRAGFSFHYEYLSKQENRRILEKVFHSLLKREVKIEFVMGEDRGDKLKATANKVAEMFNGSIITTEPKKEEKDDENG